MVGRQVSVAIATLDRPHGLARCLDGLLNGQVLPAEIIVIDQGRDNRAEIVVQERQQSQTPIIYSRQPRRGLSASRNAAIERASALVLAMTDDDCVPDVAWVATIQRWLGGDPEPANEAPSALTGRILPLGPAVPGSYAVSSRTSRTPAVLRGHTQPWRAGSGGNFAVRRAVLARVGCYDERLGAGTPGKSAEDIDYAYRLLREGVAVRYEPDTIIYHERQSMRQRVASRWTYGYGMGAFCGKWVRHGDRHAVPLLAQWLVWRSRELWAAGRMGDWPRARESSLLLRGTIGGFCYGLRLAGNGHALV